ncbi:MAG TPA: hypothetical protein VJ738_08445 [Steroidobacteraceae bacterium]|nr:hypothetical protein [Steroidobacteraceae bacterium]
MTVNRGYLADVCHTHSCDERAHVTERHELIFPSRDSSRRDEYASRIYLMQIERL